jgi:glutamine synthetase
MTEKQIIEYVKNHPSGKVKLAITDIDGIMRGKYISTEKFLGIIEGNLGFCDVVFGWDAGDVAYDNSSYTGWHSGYPDAKAKLDLGTFRKIPWENDLPFFLGEFINEADKPLEICPRQLLKKVIAEADKEGYTPYFSQEFEWFNFAETPQSLADKNYTKLTPLTPGMFGYSILRSSYRNDFFTALYDGMKKLGVPLEGLHTETGPGVYEAAIAYSGVLEAADRAVIFKTGTKEIAYHNGIIATFMAKFNENLPGTPKFVG